MNKFIKPYQVSDARAVVLNRPSTSIVDDIVNPSEATHRRVRLRKATTKMFHHGLSGRALHDIANLPGFEGKSVRPTPSSIRDYCDLGTVLLFAVGLTTVDEIIDALRDPHKYKRLGGTNTGMHTEACDRLNQALSDAALAQHVRYNTDMIFQSVRALMLAAAATSPVPPAEEIDMTELKPVLEATAILVEQYHASVDNAIKALRERGIEERVTVALKSLIDLDEDALDAVDLSGVSQAATDLANDIIDNGAIVVSLESEEIAPPVAGTSAPAVKMTLEPTMMQAVNALMTSSGMPEIGEIVELVNKKAVETETLEGELRRIKLAMSTSGVKAHASGKVASSGELPSGTTEWRNALEVLELKGIKVPTKHKHMFNFDTPYFVWEDAHRDVPPLNPAYRWRWDVLAKMMWGLAFDKRPWVWGHTGTGKTTLVEQVCAILNWPFIRINFDSEITRMDLIGRDTLKTDEHGNTISVFQDGILPQAMSQPTVICNDELDFVRPDIAYVYQRALEGNGLLLTEDGGRLIRPHEFNRMVATANTQGQGDEFGLYQGARVQSQAFLDRFQCWIEVKYLDRSDEAKLIESSVPALGRKMVDKIVKYVVEHREAFKQAAILKPISPRGVVSMAEAIAFFTALHTPEDEGKAVRMAIEATVLGSVTHADAAKINELVDRTFN